jgi:hypothetical protein
MSAQEFTEGLIVNGNISHYNPSSQASRSRRMERERIRADAKPLGGRHEPPEGRTVPGALPTTPC